MRRSLGGGGGGMIRNVQRAVMAGVGGGPPEPFSTSTTTIARNPKSLNKKQKTSPPNTALSLSSSGADNNNNNNNGSLAFSSLINFPIDSDDLEWECVEVDERGKCVICDDDDFLLGNVPSRDEVQHAVSALQQALGPPSYTHFSKRKRAEYTGKDEADEGLTNSIGSEMNSSSEEESEMDWIEPSMHLYSSRMLQTYKTSRVYDAFNLMQNEPSIQRMVFSLSSDKAVWDAVLNNEVVKELRGSISQGDDKLGEGSVEGSSPVNNILSWIVVDAPSTGSSPVNNILSWIVVNAKAKIMQLIDTITKLVNGVLEPTNDDKRGDGINPLEEKLKISLMLLVIVLLIVVVNRAQSA